MAARRNRRGRRRNRGRFGFLYKLLSVLLIFAAILVGCVVFFRVDTIVVTGQSRYTEAEIIAVTGVERGDNLFGLNKLQIGWTLLEELPYLDTVIISRRPPDTLVIEVTESGAMAAVETEGAYWLVNAGGKVLERGDAALAEGRAKILGLTPLSLSVGVDLAVPAEETGKLDALTALLSAIEGRQMTGSVTEFIDLTATNEVRFSYGADLTVIFPMVADFTEKTYALKCTLEKMDAEGVARTGTLDFTYGDGRVHLLPERWMPDTAAALPAVPEEGAQGETNES